MDTFSPVVAVAAVADYFNAVIGIGIVSVTSFVGGFGVSCFGVAVVDVDVVAVADVVAAIGVDIVSVTSFTEGIRVSCRHFYIHL